MSLRPFLQTAFWVEHETLGPDEIGTRFHHALVQVHPFPNGNGHWSRLMADVLVVGLGRPRFTWGRSSLRLADEARRAAERWNAKGAVNENTLRRFGRLWVRNLARNLGPAATSPGVERLEGLFAGMPALVLAAGPSLDAVLPHVRELSRRALVVCVDTALRSLLRFGVEPDFLVVVDPQYWNWRHLAGLESPSSLLVSETAAWPAIFRGSRRGTFLGGSLFPLGRSIEAFAGGKGGDVTVRVWDLAGRHQERTLGGRPNTVLAVAVTPDGQRTMNTFLGAAGEIKHVHSG